MEIAIKTYTKNEIEDVIQFEKNLRLEENFGGWEINEAYMISVFTGLSQILK